MKNTVDAAAFYKAMTALMEVPSKSSIEVLREIKVEFTGDQCVLSATDLDTWMSVTIPAGGDSFDFVFRNSANIQKVCRHYDGALELELQQRGDEAFLTMRSGGKGGEFPVYDTLSVNSFYIIDDAKQRDKMTEEFYSAVKKEIALYQEKADYLIQSGSRSPAIMERWVNKIATLEQKKQHYEEILRRELDGLDDEFETLRLLSQELSVRANGLRFRKAA